MQIMKNILRSHIVDLLYLPLLYVWIAVYSYPFFFKSLSSNHREIQTYNLNSMMMLTSTENALSSDFFRFTFNDYGHLYFNISIAIAYVYSLFLPLDERTLFFILRFVALLGGCFTIALVFVFARRFLGRIEAIFAAGLVAFTPAFIEYSNEVKPDTWQVFFVTLCLYFCARAVAPTQSTNGGSANSQNRMRIYFVMAAAGAAGAAFSTKYLGIILFPLLAAAALIVPAGGMSDRSFARATRLIVWLAAVLGVAFVIIGYQVQPQFITFIFPSLAKPSNSAFLHQVAQIIRWGFFLAAGLCLVGTTVYLSGLNFAAYRTPLIKISRLIAIVIIFFAVFTVTSPWVAYRLQFIAVLYERNATLNVGDPFGFQWLPYLFGYLGHDANYIGRETGVLTILGSALLLIALCRRNFRGAYLPFMFVLGFVVIFVTLMITRVNRVTVLYALPVVPPFALLAAFGLSGIRHLLTRWLGERRAMASTAALAALLIVTQIWQGANALLKYPNLVVALEPHNQMLGEWLLRCVPPNTKILAASYSYVPPRFERAIMAEGYDAFKGFNPELVIINLNIVAEAAKALEKTTANPNYETSDRSHFHEIIMRSGMWRMGPSFGRLQVYVIPQLGSAMNAGCL